MFNVQITLYQICNHNVKPRKWLRQFWEALLETGKIQEVLCLLATYAIAKAVMPYVVALLPKDYQLENLDALLAVLAPVVFAVVIAIGKTIVCCWKSEYVTERGEMKYDAQGDTLVEAVKAAFKKVPYAPWYFALDGDAQIAFSDDETKQCFLTAHIQNLKSNGKGCLFDYKEDADVANSMIRDVLQEELEKREKLKQARYKELRQQEKHNNKRILLAMCLAVALLTPIQQKAVHTENEIVEIG